MLNGRSSARLRHSSNVSEARCADCPCTDRLTQPAKSVNRERKRHDTDFSLPYSAASLTSWAATTARGGPTKCSRHNRRLVKDRAHSGGWQHEHLSAAHRADLPTKVVAATRQSTVSASSPLTSASSASSTEANYSNGSTRLPTSPLHSGVGATASPPPSATFTSTGPSASVNLWKCMPASSIRGAAVCTSLSPSAPATPPGPKQFKPPSAQSFSSLSMTAAAPSRYRGGHLSLCLNCSDNGRRGSGIPIRGFLQWSQHRLE